MNDHRRFGIADSLILIAGVAAGFALLRGLYSDLDPRDLWTELTAPQEGWSAEHVLGFLLTVGSMLATPLVIAWSPACLAVQLIKPRPRRRRLVRSLGFVACLIAVGTTAMTMGIDLMCRWLISFPLSTSSSFEGARTTAAFVGGSGILWTWMTMKLIGAWRAQPTWTDRLGRATGIAWIALGILSAEAVALNI